MKRSSDVVLAPDEIKQYHIFLASPNDVDDERRCVRNFFEEYNIHTAPLWNVRFEVLDWEHHSSLGVGRPQQLITQQTLEKYRKSLALVIGIMGQRFGSPSGKAESGTEEEFNWALSSYKDTGFPEIKWFFRKVDKFEGPSDPEELAVAVNQWNKVSSFRKQMQDLNNPVFYGEYPNREGFADVFARDLKRWLADPARPWIPDKMQHDDSNRSGNSVSSGDKYGGCYRESTGGTFGTEREYKLASPANKQFKFTTIQEATWIIQRLTDICRNLEVELQAPFTREIVDTYYDDERTTLAQHGQLVRKRVERNMVKLICKGSEQIVNRELRRSEVEVACDLAMEEELECGRIPETVKALFWNMGVHLGPIGVPFSPVLSVHNKRTEIPLMTTGGRYKFCYDKYYYEAGSDFSEYFSEIEIEVETEAYADLPDCKLQQVIDSLRLLTEYEYQATSKYKRGIVLLNKRQQSTVLWVLMFEILDLNLVEPPIQKQMLQTLSHFLKLGLQNYGVDSSLVAQNPTSEGFLIYIEQLPKYILDALRQAREQIQVIYNPGHVEYEFDFRVAIDRCQVIRYSGISEDIVLSAMRLQELKSQLVDIPGGAYVYCSAEPQTL
jgi:hypothetical protein